jgi:hypothetical protein
MLLLNIFVPSQELLATAWRRWLAYKPGKRIYCLLVGSSGSITHPHTLCEPVLYKRGAGINSELGEQCTVLVKWVRNYYSGVGDLVIELVNLVK